MPLPFIDISDQPEEVTEAIGWMYETGVTMGTSPTSFSPNEPVTRAQMALFMYRNALNADPS